MSACHLHETDTAAAAAKNYIIGAKWTFSSRIFLLVILLKRLWYLRTVEFSLHLTNEETSQFTSGLVCAILCSWIAGKSWVFLLRIACTTFEKGSMQCCSLTSVFHQRDNNNNNGSHYKVPWKCQAMKAIQSYLLIHGWTLSLD